MAGMNSWTGIGRLTRDPETRFLSDGTAVCSFSVAIDKIGKPKNEGDPTADFFRVTAWRRQAEIVQQYLQKGNQVCVQGSVSLNVYNKQDGGMGASLEVNADRITLIDSKPKDEDGQAQRPAPAQRQGSGVGGAAKAPAQAKPVQHSFPDASEFDNAFS